VFIIDDILLSPIKGLTWIAEQINEAAQQELSDEDNLMDKLMELQMRFELGEMDEKEYNKLETELLERIDSLRKEAEENVENANER
jgi:hypothetical protein